MANRIRISTAALDALGLTAAQVTAGGDVAQALGLPDGVKVTSAKVDADGVSANLAGVTLADGSTASGEVTASFTVDQHGGVTAGGLRLVGAAETDEPGQGE